MDGRVSQPAQQACTSQQPSQQACTSQQPFQLFQQACTSQQPAQQACTSQKPSRCMYSLIPFTFTMTAGGGGQVKYGAGLSRSPHQAAAGAPPKARLLLPVENGFTSFLGLLLLPICKPRVGVMLRSRMTTHRMVMRVALGAGVRSYPIRLNQHVCIGKFEGRELECAISYR